MKSLVEFLTEGKKLSQKRLEEIKGCLFNYIDANSDKHDRDPKKVMEWLQEDGIADFADEYDITNDELGSLLHDFGDIIHEWVDEFCKD